MWTGRSGHHLLDRGPRDRFSQLESGTQRLEEKACVSSPVLMFGVCCGPLSRGWTLHIRMQARLRCSFPVGKAPATPAAAASAQSQSRQTERNVPLAHLSPVTGELSSAPLPTAASLSEALLRGFQPLLWTRDAFPLGLLNMGLFSLRLFLKAA